MRLCVLLLLLLCFTLLHGHKVQRVVLTFNNSTDRSAADALVPSENVSLVKSYGRRHVLELKQPQLQLDWLYTAYGYDVSPLYIEEDVALSVSATDEAAQEQNVTAQEQNVTAQEQNVTGQILEGIYGLQQWSFLDSEPYSVHAEDAWRTKGRGDPSVVVAVLDTGLPNVSLAAFDQIASGYDFISSEELSLDGDGRDDSALDPGDQCPGNSWHGLQVASLLANLAQNCTLLPVRVLGRCRTGYASDVADAIVWASGHVINGVVSNDLPAKVISMSFAGLGECPTFLQSAINQARAGGTLLVGAAGNGASDSAGFFPGNCEGVLTVAGSTRAGMLAGYSNRGANVVVAAPGGPVPVVTATQDGSSLMQAAGVGTSFAAPHLAGALALVESVVPSFEQWAYLIQRSSWNLAPEETCVRDRTCGGGMLNVLSMLQYARIFSSPEYSPYPVNRSMAYNDSLNNNDSFRLDNYSSTWAPFMSNESNYSSTQAPFLTAATASLCPYGLYDSTSSWDAGGVSSYQYTGSCGAQEAVCKIDAQWTGGWYYGLKGYCCNFDGTLTGGSFWSTSCSGCGGTTGIAPSSTKFFGGMRENLGGVAFYGIDGSLVWSAWAAGTNLAGVPYKGCGTCIPLLWELLQQ